VVGARQEKARARRDRAEPPDDQSLGTVGVQDRVALERQRVVGVVVVRVLADLDVRVTDQRLEEDDRCWPATGCSTVGSGAPVLLTAPV